MADHAQARPTKGSVISLQQRLAQVGEYVPNIHTAYLPLTAVLRFAQMRKTFDGIQQLADNIVLQGMMNPITIASYRNTSDVAQYAEVLSQLWGVPISVPMVERFDGAVHILVAGERRYRAHLHLWQYGCSSCRERYGEQTKEGECYRRHTHLRHQRVEARCYRGLPVLAAVFMQFSENIHRPVPVHEEADAYLALLQTIRRADPTFSLAAFARSVGRSEEYIRNAIKFCELPEEFQNFVRQGTIAFGHAMQLAKLRRHVEKTTTDDLRALVNRVLAEQLSVEAFEEYIEKVILDRTSPTISLFDMSASLAETVEQHTRQTFEPRAVRAMHQITSWLGTLQRAFEQGKIGQPNAVIAEGSPARLYMSIVDRLHALLPHMLPLLPADRRSDVEQKVREMRERVERVRNRAGTA